MQGCFQYKWTQPKTFLPMINVLLLFDMLVETELTKDQFAC